MVIDNVWGVDFERVMNETHIMCYWGLDSDMFMKRNHHEINSEHVFENSMMGMHGQTDRHRSTLKISAFTIFTMLSSDIPAILNHWVTKIMFGVFKKCWRHQILSETHPPEFHLRIFKKQLISCFSLIISKLKWSLKSLKDYSWKL